MPAFNPDDDPWRRGIYRTNAQCLRISLAPQRSLLFRIKADLAEVKSYNELEDLEESPMSYSIIPSAHIESLNATSGLSALQPHHNKPPKTSLSIASLLSPTSVYSQDSWNLNSSLVPPAVDINPRQHTMDFSPTVQSDARLSPAPASVSGSMYHKMPVRTVPSSTPSSARLKMVISTSTSKKTEEDEVGDCVLFGTVQLVDEPKPVVAILQIENSEEGAVSPGERRRARET